MSFKTSKFDIFDGVEFKEATFQKKSFPLHFHDSYSIGIIKEGVERLSINNRNFDNPSKTIVILNQNETHSNGQYDEDPWTYFSFYLNYSSLVYINKLNNLPSQPNFHFQNIIQDDWLYEQIECLQHSGLKGKEMQIKEISSMLLTRYQVNPSSQDLLYRQYAPLIADAKAQLGTHYFNKINIDCLAASYHLSSFAFIRAFKAQTGLTPVSYILLLRLNYSKKLIMQNLPLVEVALECGFYDQSHFSHYFKKFFGISPLSYKKSFPTSHLQ